MILIPRAMRAARGTTGTKVRKAKQGLPEPRAYEWVGAILAICKCFCEHVTGPCICICMHADPSHPDLFCVTDETLWLAVLSLLSIKGPEGQRGPAGTRVSFDFCHCFSTSVLKTIADIWNVFWISLNHSHFSYLQGDTGERGTPGEKVWNQ